MTSIGSVGSAWSSASLQRSAGHRTPEKLLSQLDTDQSGGVDGTELQSLIDDVAQKTGTTLDTSAKDMLAQYDADGDGSLNGDELGDAMKSLLPPPPTTMEFAQSRGMAGDDLFGKVDGDGDGSVSQDELQGLLEKMSGGTASKTGTSSDELFTQLDADGDGKLSQAEFDAGRPSEQDSGMAGMPPPPPGGPGGPGGAGGAQSGSATYDPLDTNEDGTVSLSERLASSSAQEAAQALFSAIDTDGDQQLSSTEAQTFIDQLTEAATGTQQEQGTALSLAQLAEQARRAYEAVAASGSAASTAASSVSTQV
ncbi:XopAW family type III secretion system calcium-binding effector [Alicycliphilus sp. T452]